jgi:hypothetical protein
MKTPPTCLDDLCSLHLTLQKNYIFIDASCIYTDLTRDILFMYFYFFFTNFSFLALIRYEWNAYFNGIFFVSEMNKFVWLLRKNSKRSLFTDSKGKQTAPSLEENYIFGWGGGGGGSGWIVEVAWFYASKKLVYLRESILLQYCPFLATAGKRPVYSTRILV